MSREICIVGAGKLGLPVAIYIANQGHSVRAADISVATVESINQGVMPFAGEPDAEAVIATVVKDGFLRADTDIVRAVSMSDVVIVLVPLIVDSAHQPDFSALDQATSAVAAGIRPDTLISYETTLPVGTTRGRLATAIEDQSGLVVGHTFFLVHSPERVFTGRVFEDLERYPKLVGGVTNACLARGVEFYEEVLNFIPRPDLDRNNGVWPMTSAESAEMAKLAETTYRNVNIGLANEFALFAQRSNIDVYEVIDAANSQPYSQIHRPGVSVGGHCIPVYPHLYMFSDVDAAIPAASVAINEAMPTKAVDLLEDALDGLQGKAIAVLGLAYRAGVKEDAFSGCYNLVHDLQNKSAQVFVHDPLYSDDELIERGLEPLPSADSGNPRIVGAIVHTDHSLYSGTFSELIPHVAVIVDGRNILTPSNWNGVEIITIGRILK